MARSRSLKRGSLAVLFVFALGSGGAALWAQPQPVAAESTMQQRIDQVLRVLADDVGCETVATAIDLAPEVLYGGIRVVPSKGELLKQTTDVDRAIRQNELRFASALGNYARQGKCSTQRGRALDVKLFIEQISEVAQAVGRITAQCAVGDTLRAGPCADLEPLLDEATGEERTLGTFTTPLRPSFSVKLRSPAVPPWILEPQEDIRVTEPIPPQHCVVIFKEFKGLMLRLHLARVIVVTDPWVTVFGFPRGTKIPIWRLEWVFSEYVKEWNICNTDGKIRKEVTQRVKQDHPLNFFWRFYKKDP
ncbi:MAG TPA: hypothetical protein VGC93_12855 [Thermoanaerobaculia bacterium]